MTAPLERLEGRVAAALTRLDAIEDMVDTDRRVVGAEKFKVETDSDSPQIIAASEEGGLSLGTEGSWQIVGSLNEEVSHTGDVAETLLETIVVPANRMGINGILRISALFRATGAGLHTFRAKFGGTAFATYFLASNNLMVDILPCFVFNQGATDSQGSGILFAAVHARIGEAPFASAADTTADVDVDFTVQNAAGADTAFLRFALVEAYNQA